MAFESLELFNFQPHEHILVGLDVFVTTIIGPSDVGKSSLLRGLEWVCLNQPQGLAIVRNCTGDDPWAGSKFVEAILKFDGHVLRRRRTSDDNLYILDGQEFRAFGTNVPEEISRLLAVHGICFVVQGEPHFWFSLTSGEVSKEINEIVDLSIIDRTQAAISKIVSIHRATSKVCADRLQAAKEQKKALAWVEQADADLSQIELALEAKQRHSKAVVELSAIIALISESRDKRNRLEAMRLQAVACGRQGAEALELSDRRAQLESILQSIDRARAVLKRGYPDLTELASAGRAYDSIRKRCIDLGNLIGRIKSSESRYIELVDIENQANADLWELGGDKCPVCGK